MEKLQEAVCRIREMEARFDRLLADAARPEDLRSLLNYYENGLWLQDYSLDEQNLLPPDLKRGILSEDGFYNLLSDRSPESH